MDEPSRAVLVPANRFEVVECVAATEAVEAGDLDGEPPRPGGLDVLAQHVLAMACSAPFREDELYAEVTRAGPYAGLTRRDFDDVVRFVEDGGYALQPMIVSAGCSAMPRVGCMCAASRWSGSCG
jgi:ATP-dependent Lhr-like helicase